MTMSKYKMYSLVVAAICAALAFVIYVRSGVSDAIAVNAPVLMGLRQEWLLEGSPDIPNIVRYPAYVADPKRFFVWTNVYTIDGRNFHCILGMNDSRFEGTGMLVVSKDGQLIWLDKVKPAKLIKLKN